MSRNKPNLGEPYQIYAEVLNVGKTVEGSKKRVRWLFGFTEKEGEVEVSLIHSLTSGKKTLFEDGKEIVSSTNRLATDFGHTWRSESCQGRLFRVEFVTSFTTDPTIYTFTVDGIKFVDMPKKSGIGGGGSSSYNSGGAKNRSVNGFGTSNAAADTSSNEAGHRNSTGNNQNTNTNTNRNSSSGFGTSQPAPAATTSTSRRFIYDDDGDDTETHTAPSKPAQSTPAGAPRANFQSPFAPANTATNAGFGFDPFDESPAPAPAAANKPTAAASLFNAFDESPPKPVVKKTSSTFDAFGNDDPFGSSDPFGTPAAAAPAPAQAAPTAAQRRASFNVPKAASPAPAPVAATGSATKSVPNFLDDDFAAPAAPPAAAASNDFGFGAVNTAPQRRSSAIEISHDFAGMSFAPPVPVAAPPVPVAAPPVPVVVATPEPAAPVSKDPWSQGNLVNLDFTGAASTATKRPSGSGPSLSSMMTTAPTNSRASFTAGSPSAAAPMMGQAQGQGQGQMMGNMGQQNAYGNVNPFSQTPAGNNGMSGGFGSPQPMGMGGQQPMAMGGMNMNNNNVNMNNVNSRASFTAGPGAANPFNNAPAGGSMGMGGGAMGGPMGGPMGGGMGNANTRGSFISANPTPGMGYGAPQGGLGQAPKQQQPPKSSLDSLDWNM